MEKEDLPKNYCKDNCPFNHVCEQTGKPCRIVEKYLQKFHTKRREEYFEESDISEYFENTAPMEWPTCSFTRKELVVLFYFIDELPLKEIEEKTGYSERQIRRIRNDYQDELKGLIDSNKKRPDISKHYLIFLMNKKFFLKQSQISEMINVSQAYVSKALRQFEKNPVKYGYNLLKSRR